MPYFPEMIPQARGDHVIAPTPAERAELLGHRRAQSWGTKGTLSKEQTTPAYLCGSCPCSSVPLRVSRAFSWQTGVCFLVFSRGALGAHPKPYRDTCTDRSVSAGSQRAEAEALSQVSFRLSVRHLALAFHPQQGCAPLGSLCSDPSLFLSQNGIDAMHGPRLYRFCGTIPAAEPPPSLAGRGGTRLARTRAVSC